MATYKDFGRSAMTESHGVFNVHDIPPAAYYGPGMGSLEKGTIPKFSFGDVCSKGLWDEAVDEPIVYPFTAAKSGFCYIPNYKEPNVLNQIEAASRASGKLVPDLSQPLTAFDSDKPRLNPSSDCVMACKWND